MVYLTGLQVMKRKKIDPQIESQLAYLFQKNLLKAENPKFPGCYFIGHVVNTFSKIFPETSIDEIQLVHFAYNNSSYYVHLSPEMVKTQLKYVGSSNQQNPNSARGRPKRRSSIKKNTKKVFQKTSSLSPETNKINSNTNNTNSNGSNNDSGDMNSWENVDLKKEEKTTYDVNGFPVLKYKEPKTFIRSKYFGAVGENRPKPSLFSRKKNNDIDFSSLEESLKSIKF